MRETNYEALLRFNRADMIIVGESLVLVVEVT
jgi:hypothetical protein